MKVSVIGYGWVGKAMHQLFPDALVYLRNSDKMIGKDINSFTNHKELINECDVAFIAVPTPLKEIGQILDTSIVEECISWCECPLLVVRSTVNPGDCDRWAKKYDKKIVMQPEYLGETPNHPLLNQKHSQFIILGGDKKETRKLINLYATVYNANIKIRQVSRLEAEVIKLSENRAIAFKVMQCQELYDVCQKAKLDYYTIRDAVYGDDPRMNLWFTFIYPDKRGFNNSKCLRKDVPAFAMWCESIGYVPDLTWALIRKSNNYETYGE